ncbi:Imm42 family immunity protein [Silvimonas amylolytica]|uniref:Imm42 family immunity protein n=1 Tax=Silvimonas amylolytica TaxID=449663 RepID=UPI0035711DD6
MRVVVTKLPHFPLRWSDHLSTGCPKPLTRTRAAAPVQKAWNISPQIDPVSYSKWPIPTLTVTENGLMVSSSSSHTPGGKGNRLNAGIEPGNYPDLFNSSIPGQDRARYVTGERQCYSLFSDRNISDEGCYIFLAECDGEARVIWGYQDDEDTAREFILKKGEFQSVVQSLLDRFTSSTTPT